MLPEIWLFYKPKFVRSSAEEVRLAEDRLDAIGARWHGRSVFVNKLFDLAA